MDIQKNISLKKYNTFGIDVLAKYYVSVNTITELQEVIQCEKDILLLSGGSNMLLTADVESLVIHLNLKGIRIISENENEILIKVAAGENWHKFVLWCINNDHGGLENLSLIPGNIGTSPIQNIGAYGVEVKDVIQEVEAVEIKTGKIITFANSDCNFGYRNSIFKNDVKGKFIITSVTFKLTKNEHQLNISYGAIQSELNNKKITNPTIRDVSNAVITIRKSKLPNPKEIGNGGSFFKNPIITVALFKKLQKKYPEIPSYQVSEEFVKVPAGWLIEQAGYKGKRFGNVGIHKKQALVLVNYGNATGAEILHLAHKVQREIHKKFNISLEIEVNIIE